MYTLATVSSLSSVNIQAQIAKFHWEQQSLPKTKGIAGSSRSEIPLMKARSYSGDLLPDPSPCIPLRFQTFYTQPVSINFHSRILRNHLCKIFCIWNVCQYPLGLSFHHSPSVCLLYTPFSIDFIRCWKWALQASTSSSTRKRSATEKTVESWLSCRKSS